MAAPKQEQQWQPVWNPLLNQKILHFSELNFCSNEICDKGGNVFVGNSQTTQLHAYFSIFQ